MSFFDFWLGPKTPRAPPPLCARCNHRCRGPVDANNLCDGCAERVAFETLTAGDSCPPLGPGDSLYRDGYDGCLDVCKEYRARYAPDYWRRQLKETK